MTIQNLTDEIILVELPKASLSIGDELETLNQTISENDRCDVILDFSEVEILVSTNISHLLILKKLLEDQEKHLFLCNVAPLTKRIFQISGLASMFNFVSDKTEAIKAIR